MIFIKNKAGSPYPALFFIKIIPYYNYYGILYTKVRGDA